MAKRHPPLSKEQTDRVARLFRSLGEPTRLQILQALHQGPLAVGQIVEALGVKQANVSKQLGLLHAANLVKRQRDGLQVRYAIADPIIFDLCELVCGKLQRDAAAQVQSFAGVTRKR